MKPARLAFFALLVIAAAAGAQMRGKRLGGDDGAAGGIAERREAVIEATGLSPVFPEGFACEPVSSPYGSPARYDGSPRRLDRNGGLHGGMDITLPEGTPLLAVANGEVIAKGEGGLLEGIFL